MVNIDPGKVTKPSNVVPFSRRIVGEFSITIYILGDKRSLREIDYFTSNEQLTIEKCRYGNRLFGKDCQSSAMSYNPQKHEMSWTDV